MEKPISKIPAARYKQILEWLEQEGIISIQELQERLNVSHMTVHRDLDHLAAQQQVKKVRGGVMRARDPLPPTPQRQNCSMCGGRVLNRTEVVIHRSNGERILACCPHCGIMMITDSSEEVSILARDFIYGRMVNIFQATYVVDSEVRVCCVPSTLCFASMSDAQKFQHGFEGKVLNFKGVHDYLMRAHHHH
ncbi:MAG: DeoR family transcriptional regulator [Candidatus Promineifilaceae bacterium]|nr:DeoR family transcriptional regulator [Candidatus Promineifilaceae bacterium]